MLVTGGARRIGREICLTLARMGYPIALHYNRSRECALEVAEEVNREGVGRVKLFQADLTAENAIKDLICDVLNEGELDHVVNNASVYRRDTLSSLTSASFDEMISINLKAPLFITREFVSYLSRRTAANPSLCSFPSITNLLDQKIASTNGDYLSYTVAKHGLHNLTDMLAKDCSPLVRVNAVAPGPIFPHESQTKKSFELAQERCVLRYSPSAQDVAESVSFLIQSKAITGQTLFVDSGDRFTPRLKDDVDSS